MTGREWKRLGVILAARGMSAGRVGRVLGELDDHARDIREELEARGLGPAEAGVMALRRMGDTETLADNIFRGYARRTLWGRHPVFLSIVLPFLSVALVTVAAVMVGNLFFGPLLKALEVLGLGTGFPVVRALCMGLFTLGRYVSTAIAAWFLLRAAKKRVLEMKWAFLTAGVTALLGFLLFPYLRVFPPEVAGKIVSGSFAVGLGLSAAFFQSADHWTRFLIPLVLFAAFYSGNLKASWRKRAG